MISEKTSEKNLQLFTFPKDGKSSKNILDKKMTIKQLLSIDQNELFTIGGHSHKHKIFSQLSEKEVKKSLNSTVFNLLSSINVLLSST